MLKLFLIRFSDCVLIRGCLKYSTAGQGAALITQTNLSVAFEI